MKTPKLILFFLATLNLFSQEFINVANISEYNEAIKNAKPGTNIILENGIWKDVHLKAYGKGTKENPIVVKAKKAGKVIISGDSRLQIYGEHIIVEGLWFKDGKVTNSTIVTFQKDSKEFANNCRFTNNAITYYNPNYQGFKTHWVALWGKNNRVDHNNFTGKKNEGTTLVVWLKGDAHIENNHSIDSNYFGERPFLDRRNAETIRIGTSKNSMKSSKTIVENNTFEKCDAELEIISNKSCDNIYRNNLFIGSKGTLTLRHGNNILVENNVFLGNNVSKTGGIRIINKGHIVRNNLLVGIKGSGNRGPIVLMNGVPNSPLNRYHQVDDVSIQNNTLIDCSTIQLTSGKNDEKTLPPINTLFANNLIAKSSTKVSDATDAIDGITFKNNIVEASGEFNRYLFSNQKIDWKNLKSYPMPTGKNKNLISDFKDSKTPEFDINGVKREPFVVGAFNLDNTKLPKALTNKTGTSWDTSIVKSKFKGRRVLVEPGVGTLAQAIKKASGKTMLLLSDGAYYVNKEQKIYENITIKGNKNTIIKSEESIEKPFKSFFKINENTTLKLENLTIDGGVNTIKYAVISPSKGASNTYNLFVENCVFKNFKNKKGGYIIKAYTNTLADTISIKDSYFRNSYRGINFHSKENTMINAKTIIIENTVFNNIEGFALKYIKKEDVTDPTKGNLTVTNSVFSNVNNKEKGKIIEVKGITFSEVKNCVFEKSNSIINTVDLSGKENTISNCLVYNSGKIKTSKGAIQKNIMYKKPKWKDKKNFTPNRRSPLLKKNNKIETIGLL